MEMQIVKRKLLFLHHLISLDESSLAREILQVQDCRKLPGLVQESKNLITQLNLPDIFEKQVFTGLSKLSWKRLVNSAIRKVEESRLKEIILVKSKLKDGPMATENFEQKEYLTTMKLPESRVKFQLRSKMLDAKMNYSAQHEKEL